MDQTQRFGGFANLLEAIAIDAAQDLWHECRRVIATRFIIDRPYERLKDLKDLAHILNEYPSLDKQGWTRGRGGRCSAFASVREIPPRERDDYSYARPNAARAASR
jgi:hypothetical protein